MPAGEQTDGRWAWPFTAGLSGLCPPLSAEARWEPCSCCPAPSGEAVSSGRERGRGGDAGCTENHWAPRLVPEVVLTEPATPRDGHVSRSEPEAE